MSFGTFLALREYKMFTFNGFLYRRAFTCCSKSAIAAAIRATSVTASVAIAKLGLATFAAGLILLKFLGGIVFTLLLLH